MLTPKEIDDIVITLEDITEDMMLGDFEKSYKDAKFGYKQDPLDFRKDSVKYLHKTQNYIRAHYRSVYVGIARRDDSRFNSKGFYKE